MVWTKDDEIKKLEADLAEARIKNPNACAIVVENPEMLGGICGKLYIDSMERQMQNYDFYNGSVCSVASGVIEITGRIYQEVKDEIQEP